MCSFVSKNVPKNKSTTFEGYVVYAKNTKHKDKPIAIVNSKGEYSAYCDLSNIPSKTIKYLVSIEDKRFFNHGCVDVKSLFRALYINCKRLKISQGGSTISQQLARNLMRNNKKNLTRKVNELIIASELERTCSKEQILELYLNHTFWGNKCYGYRAASLLYFSKEPWDLSKSESILLISILKGPNSYLNSTQLMMNRFKDVNQCLFDNKHLKQKEANRNIANVPKIIQFKPLIFQNKCIDYIAKSINRKDKIIYSTIDIKLQKQITSFFSLRQIPMSLIVIKDMKVIGLHSYFGTDYPFEYKSNVGSTLKPFIYYYLLNNGIEPHHKFSTKFTDILNWNIREIQYPNSKMISLEEALYLSNNNTFLSACNYIGMDGVLQYLSEMISIDRCNLTNSSILGSTICGLSLYQLAIAYYNLLYKVKNSPELDNTLEVLNRIAFKKLGIFDSSLFLKTGTTNNNRDMFAIIGHEDLLFAYMWHDYDYICNSKEGTFLNVIRRFILSLAKKNHKTKY